MSPVDTSGNQIPDDWDDAPATTTPLSAARLEAREELVHDTAAATAGAYTDLHLADQLAAHPASAISVSPVTGVSATTVQGALAELGSSSSAPNQPLYVNDGSPALAGTLTVPMTGVRTAWAGGVLAGNLIVNITGDFNFGSTVFLRFKQAATGGPYSLTVVRDGSSTGITWAGTAPAPVLTATAGAVERFTVQGNPDQTAEITKLPGPFISTSTYNSVIDADSPIAHWKLGEASPGPYVDRKNALNSNTVNGAPVLVSGLVANNSTDGATQMNITTDEILVNSNALLDVGDVFTLEAWVKRDPGGPGTSRTILSKQTNGFSLTFSATNNVLLRKSGVSDIAASTIAITDTTDVHHIVCTKNGATVKIYVDGADVTGTVTNATIANTALSLQLGRFMGGRIDEAAIYGTALSATRVAAHFQAGFGVAPGNQITFTADNTTEFPNPERGFWRGTSNVSFVGGGDTITDARNGTGRKVGLTLIQPYFRLDAYKTNPVIAQSWIDGLTQFFLDSRTLKIKIVPRFTYNFSAGDDAIRTVTLAHIQQLGPILETYKDCIAWIQAGMVGRWAEWHTSTHPSASPDDVLGSPQNTAHLNNSATNRALYASGTAIYNAMMTYFPQDRFIAFRYPVIKKNIYGFNSPLTSTEAFSGSNKSRHAHHNDSFLGNTDNGTTWNAGTDSVATVKAYVSQDSLYTPTSGETVNPTDLGATNPSPFWDAANWKAEMASQHWCGLNIDYYANAISSLADADFNEIKRNIGYRFQLTTATLPPSAVAAGNLAVTFTIANVGYGMLPNLRPVQIVLKNQSGGAITRIDTTGIDPRRWSGGTSKTNSVTVTLPPAVAAGSYDIGIGMPDPSAARSADPLEAVRFANTSVWNATDGVNYFPGTTLTVT